MAIQAKFWNAATDGTQLGQTFEYSGINLSAGIFTVDLAFTADQIAVIFGDGSSLVYIEISSENKTYPRQQFSYVPFALRVPFDGKTLAFDTNGKLSLSLTTKPGTNQFLTKDSDGKLIWGTPAAATIQNQAIAIGTPSSGQVLTYNGSQWSASTPTSGGGGGSGVTGTLAVTSGGTGATNFANNGVLIGAGSLPVSTATGSQYQVFTSGAGGTLGFSAVNLAQSAAVSGVLPTANGGTGVNSTATFPASGTGDATETLTNKTITTATINGNSTIAGSTEINTTGTIASGAATVSGNVAIKGNGTTAGKLILNDKGSTNSVSIKAPDTLASSLIIELPSTTGISGQVLATNGSGSLSWASGTAPTGAASGDLTGSYPNPTLSNVGTAGAYSKVLVDGKGRVTSGSTLAAADIPNLSASQITSGTLNSAQLPTIGTAGTYAKVTTDAYGRVTTGNTLGSDDIPPISASLINSGTLNSALLPTIGSAGTYAKVTTDVYGRITAGTTLSSSDVTSSLGYMPINKSGDTMNGALNLGSYDLTSAGNIQMSASKTFGLSANTADPTGLVSVDKGRTWFNTTTNQIKYWDGSAAVALGVSGSGLSSFNGQTGNTQTLATPGTTGIAPAWSSTSNAHTLNIPLASTASVSAGLISNSDYNTFNGKVAGVTSGTGVSVSTTGNIATVNLATAGTAGTYAKVTTDAYGRVTAGTTLAGTDITSSLGFTPLNKAGDAMSGALTLPANGLVAGTNQLVLANSNVGIGTTAPTSTLDVQKSFGGGMPATTGTSEPNAIMRLRSDGGATLDWGMIATGSAWIQPRYYTNLATNLNLLLNPNGGNVGIGTTSPNTVLQVAGPIATAYSAKTAAYSITASDSVIATDTSSGTFAITLPSAASIAGRQYMIKKNDSSTNPLTVATTSSQTIDGASNAYLNFAGESLVVASDGSNWIVIGGNAVAESPARMAGGRLTLTSGTPVTTSDVTGATTIYYTSYLDNRIALFDGVRTWNTFALPKDTSSANCSAGAPCYQVALALGTLTGALPYDVFIYNNAGTPALELQAWSSATARATSIVLQDGVYVKNGSSTRRYLGTFYTMSATTTEDSVVNRLVWNASNRVPRKLKYAISTTQWTYSTSAWRAANGNNAYRVNTMVGLPLSTLNLSVVSTLASNSATGTFYTLYNGIAEDATNNSIADSQNSMGAAIAMYSYAVASAVLVRQPAIGFHYYQWTETGYLSTGNNGTVSGELAGLLGTIDN